MTACPTCRRPYRVAAVELDDDGHPLPTHAETALRRLHPDWCDDLVSGLIAHPKRCAPSMAMFARITGLPRTTARDIWSAAA